MLMLREIPQQLEGCLSNSTQNSINNVWG